MNDFLQDFTVHNPGSLPREVLLEEFVARDELLEDLLNIIRENNRAESQQHVLLIGPRGMGKTTCFYATSYLVEGDEALDREWRPLIFSEENYGIGDLADFWLEALRLLEEEQNSSEDQARQLLEENPSDLADRARETFLSLLDREGKRCLLLLDNIHDIFTAILKEKDLHALRAFLMEDSRVMIMGSSPSYFSQIQNLNQPFYDFFRIFSLERFNKVDMEKALRIMAERRQDEKVLRVLEKEPERVHSLRILTGGNPRLVKMVYRLLHEGAFRDVRRDLNRLLDECTPYFKHRIESLTAQSRRVFDAIAREWDPIGVKNLTVQLRKASNHISAQIKRLVEEGFVEEAGGSEKKKRYQVAERFYNIFYLMRYSRSGRKRLDWLIGFMKVFYTLDDFRKWADITEKEARSLKDPSQREERLCYLSTLTSAAPAELREELLETTIRTTIDTEGMKALKKVLDAKLAKKELGSSYTILEVLMRLSDEEQQKIGYQPKNAEWWYNVGRELYFKNDFQNAELTWRKAIEINPKYARPWNAMGNLFQQHLRSYKESEEAYRKAIEIDPQLADSYNGLGLLLLFFLNRYEEAEKYFNDSIKIDSKCASPWNGLGYLFQLMKRYKEAEEAYRKAIEIDPQAAISWCKLGNLLSFFLDRHEEGEKAYRKAIEIEPNWIEPWRELGNLFFFLEKYEEAKEALLMVLKINSNDSFSWNNIGRLYAEHFNKYEEAEKAFRKAIEIDPKGANFWSGLGNILIEHFNRYKEGEEAYRTAIEIDPKFALPWNGLGLLFQKYLGRYKEAEIAYRNAIEINPGFFQPWSNLGDLYQNNLTQYKEAESAYRKAIEINKNDAQTWNSLGCLLEMHLNSFKEAEKAFKKAIELSPHESSFWLNLGNLFQFNIENYKEAEAAYRKAIEVDPKYAFPYCFLALLLIEKKEKERQARQLTVQAYCLAPSELVLLFTFQKVCSNYQEDWFAIFPSIFEELEKHPEDEGLIQFAMSGLIRLVQLGEAEKMKGMLESSPVRDIFEPILLALEVQRDESILQTLAPERRELVLEVRDKMKEKTD